MFYRDIRVRLLTQHIVKNVLVLVNAIPPFGGEATAGSKSIAVRLP